MSRLDETTVRHVAHLARISVSDAEVSQYAAQLAQILDYIDLLNELDTSEIPPTADPQDTHDVFRSDVPHSPWSAGEALKNAPDRHGEFFRVPKVLDQGDA